MFLFWLIIFNDSSLSLSAPKIIYCSAESDSHSFILLFGKVLEIDILKGKTAIKFFMLQVANFFLAHLISSLSRKIYLPLYSKSLIPIKFKYLFVRCNPDNGKRKASVKRGALICEL